MSKLRLLDFQYNLSRKQPARPFKWLSAKDRQISGLLGGPLYEPSREEMKRVFKKIDGDGDGRISQGDLRRLLIITTLGTSEDVDVKANKMLQAADMDGDGFIGFKDFMEVHKTVSTSEIRAAFQYLDVDGDGRIGADDLHRVMSSLGERCTFADCRRMVRSVDKSGDGLVDMDDFMAMMTATMVPLV
ncbi:hypothetical protein Taro_055513 [Colocasia esculenta]|uniref:EF-hand domain-containing protein n=1 Tax=Colocasia esculenta TaxID=4460 RepID=A0A843XRK7_COLES|nr:hypothetical protein [Colocasia esculenta]